MNIAAGSHEVEMKEQNVQTEDSVEKQGMWLHLHLYFNGIIIIYIDQEVKILTSHCQSYSVDGGGF